MTLFSIPIFLKDSFSTNIFSKVDDGAIKHTQDTIHKRIVNEEEKLKQILFVKD